MIALTRKLSVLLALIPALISGQQVGTYETETHPKLPYQTCTSSGCTTVSAGQVSLDANWRWTHVTDGYTNCYTGNAWNTTVCTDNKVCASKCAVEGAKYQETYGITASGNALTLKFVTQASQKNVGSRVYLMESETKYKVTNLLNTEFTFDVDVSQLPCGLNGALYFIQMDGDGGMSKYSGNKAGAKYGTGYCDSQCPRDIKFINGEANSEGWTPATGDPNGGTGKYGTCCAEMDIWEANSMAAAYTPHPCKTTNSGGQQRCTGTECNSPRYEGLCDPDGCDFNHFRMGDKTYFGKGMTVDTNKKMTVVTQFITVDGTSTGQLKEIRRIYVQDVKVFQNSKVNFPGISAYDSITDQFCTDSRTLFGDFDSFKRNGGMAQMSASLAKGHVLALSIWDDHTAHMLWLDGNYPTDANPATPGIARGACGADTGVPAEVEANHPNAQVVFSNIKFGSIGSTFGGGTGTTTTTTSTTTTTGGGAQQTPWGQCGGNNWTGPTQCQAPYTCKFNNEWYSQCLP